MATFSSLSIATNALTALQNGPIYFSSVHLKADTDIILPIETFRNLQNGFVSIRVRIDTTGWTADKTVTAVEFYYKVQKTDATEAVFATTKPTETWTIPKAGPDDPYLSFMVPIGSAGNVTNPDTVYAPTDNTTFLGDVRVNGRLFLSDGSYIYVQE